MKNCWWLAGVLLVVLLLTSCRQNDVLSRVRAGDFSLVYKGTYRGNLRFLGQGREHETTVQQLRADIEGDKSVMDLISGEFYELPHDEYHFKYAAIDEERDIMLLRYFARIPEHALYAGYQIQFVFARTPLRLQSIYTSEVPLE